MAFKKVYSLVDNCFVNLVQNTFIEITNVYIPKSHIFIDFLSEQLNMF